MLPNHLKDALVHPIRIPTPFAVGDVYCYLIKDEKIVLVDTGQNTGEAFGQITKEFKNYGLSVRDLDEIWLTHGHPDHFGQAMLLADRSGAVVYGHPKERANFAGNNDGELFAAFFDKHFIPEKFIEQMVNQLNWLQQFQLPLEPEWITEGDVLSSGELSVKVRHAPGHAPGHVVFDSNRDLLFGGDVLLRHISTNALINFDPDTRNRNRSLMQYRESLKWIRKKNEVVLPGHGEIIEDAAAIADHHLQEHEARYKKIQKLLQQGPITLIELSNRVFPDAIQQGALFLVLSEVIGYLDWGIEEGVIALDESTMSYLINEDSN